MAPVLAGDRHRIEVQRLERRARAGVGAGRGTAERDLLDPIEDFESGDDLTEYAELRWQLHVCEDDEELALQHCR